MAELGNRELSGRVIEAAIAVRRALGPGFPEAVDESALCVELQRRGIGCERQKAIRIVHAGVEVGEHRLDLLIEGVLVVERKAVRAMEDVLFAIGRSCLKAADLEDGLILNFATRPLAVKRIGREWSAAS